MSIAEMRMLRWTSGVERVNRIRNKCVRGNTRITPIVDKMGDNILRWFGHVMRRETEAVRMVMKIVEGKRGKGRPKLDMIEREIKGSAGVRRGCERSRQAEV